jgi:hypothetical protein
MADEKQDGCIHASTQGIEVVVGLVCITVIALAAIFVMKEKANEIAIAGVSGMVGWLSKTGYDWAKEKLNGITQPPAQP